MANHSVNIDGDNKPILSSSFADMVHHDWIKSKNPDEVITCTEPENVSISSNADLCCSLINKAAPFNWSFKILTNGKKLQRVILTLGQNRNNFTLMSVSNKTNKIIGVTNGQEWYNSNSKVGTLNGNRSNSTLYIVTIRFYANEYGTYRQNVIFYFGEYPVILRRICFDCVPSEDYSRLHAATEYQFVQNSKVWIDPTIPIRQFESPFVRPKDPKEARLSVIYPYPCRRTFLLTQETLTDDRLTPENYRGRLHELISVEEIARHEQIARYNEHTFMRLLSHYILASAGDASTVAKYAPPGELFAKLPLSRNISEDTKSGRLFLRGCDSLLFKSTNSKSNPNTVFEAHIEDKCTQIVYIRLSKNCVDTLNLVADMDIEVQVQFKLSRLPFCEWHRAVDSLPDTSLVFLSKVHKEIQESHLTELRNIDLSAASESWDWLILNPLLNAEQKRALTVMTASTKISLPPILLLGPFGTGKTFTIAQAIRMLIVNNPEHKILLCTHSNSAADLYVKEFFNSWYTTENCPRLKPVRVYYKGRARNTVHPVVQKYSLKEENGTFRDPNDEDVRNCSLIVTTLATSSSLTCLNLSLTHIIIDEAAQALECEVLIPLSLATPETRLILAGDQMQLAPEIYSNLANERGLGISLLERIFEMYPPQHPCRIHLCQNYRAHADIIRFTSEMFYDGIVKAGNRLLMSHPVLKPLTFYAVQGEEVQAEHSTGYVHATEAHELADRVLELKNKWPVSCWGPYDEGSIGVLAYYAEQVQRIRAELRKRKLFDVSVERVLNVQGKQFMAVFISTVRTRTCCRYSAERNLKDYGFLTNPRLLNTAITRAKCLVAAVGDPIALTTVGCCRKLWQKYLEAADLHGIDRQSLNLQLTLVPKLALTTPLNPLAQEFVPRNRSTACVVEYVPLPVMYPVVHCAPQCWNLH